MKMSQEEKDARKTAREFKKLVEHIKSRIASDLKDCRAMVIPEPTRRYEVGDRVKYGNWDWSSILEVADDGNVYKLFSVTRNTGRNVPDCTKGKIHWLTWYDFQPYITREENDTREVFTRDDDIFFQYMQRDMSGLLNYYFQSYGIDLNPEYQRGNVWNQSQKESLIESIFNNIDIGKFAVIKRPWSWISEHPANKKLYEMLDGKQRMTALVEYFTGQITFRGKYYDQLSWTDKNHFKYYTISVAETAPLSNEQKYRYFLKLNTTGTPVDAAHMERVAGLLAKEIEKNV